MYPVICIFYLFMFRNIWIWIMVFILFLFIIFFLILLAVYLWVYGCEQFIFGRVCLWCNWIYSGGCLFGMWTVVDRICCYVHTSIVSVCACLRIRQSFVYLLLFFCKKITWNGLRTYWNFCWFYEHFYRKLCV